MTQLNTDDLQSIAVTVIEQVALELDRKLNGVRLVEIEPHVAFQEETLPGVGIYLGEELVISTSENSVGGQDRIVDGKFVSGQESIRVDRVQQFYNIVVIAQQSKGAYSKVGAISKDVERHIRALGISNLYYNGSDRFRSDTDNSLRQHARVVRYYLEYEK